MSGSIAVDTNVMVAWDVIERMTDELVRQFDPDRIILFGSHARGTAGPDSDVDFLVVLPHVEDKLETTIEMRRRLARFPAAKDIIVTSPEEIRERGDLVGSILRPALREGKVVYDRQVER